MRGFAVFMCTSTNMDFEVKDFLSWESNLRGRSSYKFSLGSQHFQLLTLNKVLATLALLRQANQVAVDTFTLTRAS